MTAKMLLATGEHLLLGAIVPAARPHQKTRRQKKEITYAHPLEHSGSAEEVESDRKQGNGEHNEHQDGNGPPGRQHPRRWSQHSSCPGDGVAPPRTRDPSRNFHFELRLRPTS